MYHNLPLKFHRINNDELIVVHSNGALEVAHKDFAYFHDSQWTHYSGRGGYVHDWWYTADDNIENLKVQGAGRRWAYLPWTMDQEVSCRPRKLRLRMSTDPPETIRKARNGLYARITDSPVGSGAGQEHLTDAGGLAEMKNRQDYLKRKYDSDSDADADDEMEENDQRDESQIHTGGDRESESDGDVEGRLVPSAASKVFTNVNITILKRRW